MRPFQLLSLLLALVLVAPVLGPPAANAQAESAWLQIEAQPSLVKAQERARAYAARLDHVAGFALGNGWYAIVLGPYTRGDAEMLRARLLATGEIPGDSYLTEGSRFTQQFWPIGTGAALTPQPLPDGSAGLATDRAAAPDLGPELGPELGPGIAPEIAADPGPAVTLAPAPDPALPDETRAEALASEALLSRPEKERLQIALQWAGTYPGAIDGAFGRGTRAAMEDWQRARGHDATGVLTTQQRAQLVAEYNAVLDGLDLAPVRDDAAGIELLMPQAQVAFSRYEPPFALYDSRDGGAAQVILISQEGDAAQLAGLYEIMQTLEIVPPEGPRERRADSFTLEGIDSRIHSHAQAQVTDGHIKGFVLVWPAGDEDRFARLLAKMQVSFTLLPRVLDPGIAPPDEDQSIDLVSGLAIRQPRLSRSGAFINDTGDVLTSAAAVAECGEITVAGGHPARVAFTDPVLGVAVLTPDEPLAPGAVATFQTQVPRLQSQIAVAGFPYGAALAQPVLTFGTLADIRGLDGESGLRRLSLPAREGDAGGAVFDNGGAVVGLLLPAPGDTAQALPRDVAFARSAGDIVAALEGAGIPVTTTDRIAFVEPATLTREAARVGVLVSCW